MSSITVILNARLARLLANKKDDETRKSPTKVMFLQAETHFYRSFDCACGNESIIYTFQRSTRANRNINIWKEKRKFTGYPAAKHPKHSKFAITDMREKPVDFFAVQHGRQL